MYREALKKAKNTRFKRPFKLRQEVGDSNVLELKPLKVYKRPVKNFFKVDFMAYNPSLWNNFSSGNLLYFSSNRGIYSAIHWLQDEGPDKRLEIRDLRKPHYLNETWDLTKDRFKTDGAIVNIVENLNFKFLKQGYLISCKLEAEGLHEIRKWVQKSYGRDFICLEFDSQNSKNPSSQLALTTLKKVGVMRMAKDKFLAGNKYLDQNRRRYFLARRTIFQNLIDQDLTFIKFNFNKTEAMDLWDLLSFKINLPAVSLNGNIEEIDKISEISSSGFKRLEPDHSFRCEISSRELYRIRQFYLRNTLLDNEKLDSLDYIKSQTLKPYKANNEDLLGFTVNFETHRWLKSIFERILEVNFNFIRFVYNWLYFHFNFVEGFSKKDDWYLNLAYSNKRDFPGRFEVLKNEEGTQERREGRNYFDSPLFNFNRSLSRSILYPHTNQKLFNLIENKKLKALDLFYSVKDLSRHKLQDQDQIHINIKKKAEGYRTPLYEFKLSDYWLKQNEIEDLNWTNESYSVLQIERLFYVNPFLELNGQAKEMKLDENFDLSHSNRLLSSMVDYKDLINLNEPISDFSNLEEEILKEVRSKILKKPCEAQSILNRVERFKFLTGVENTRRSELCSDQGLKDFLVKIWFKELWWLRDVLRDSKSSFKRERHFKGNKVWLVNFSERRDTFFNLWGSVSRETDPVNANFKNWTTSIFREDLSFNTPSIYNGLRYERGDLEDPLLGLLDPQVSFNTFFKGKIKSLKEDLEFNLEWRRRNANFRDPNDLYINQNYYNLSDVRLEIGAEKFNFYEIASGKTDLVLEVRRFFRSENLKFEFNIGLNLSCRDFLHHHSPGVGLGPFFYLLAQSASNPVVRLFPSLGQGILGRLLLSLSHFYSILNSDRELRSMEIQIHRQVILTTLLYLGGKELISQNKNLDPRTTIDGALDTLNKFWFSELGDLAVNLNEHDRILQKMEASIPKNFSYIHESSLKMNLSLYYPVSTSRFSQILTIWCFLMNLRVKDGEVEIISIGLFKNFFKVFLANDMKAKFVTYKNLRRERSLEDLPESEVEFKLSFLKEKLQRYDQKEFNKAIKSLTYGRVRNNLVKLFRRCKNSLLKILNPLGS